MYALFTPAFTFFFPVYSCHFFPSVCAHLLFFHAFCVTFFPSLSLTKRSVFLSCLNHICIFSFYTIKHLAVSCLYRVFLLHSVPLSISYYLFLLHLRIDILQSPSSLFSSSLLHMSLFVSLPSLSFLPSVPLPHSFPSVLPHTWLWLKYLFALSYTCLPVCPSSSYPSSCHPHTSPSPSTIISASPSHFPPFIPFASLRSPSHFSYSNLPVTSTLPSFSPYTPPSLHPHTSPPFTRISALPITPSHMAFPHPSKPSTQVGLGHDFGW